MLLEYFYRMEDTWQWAALAVVQIQLLAYFHWDIERKKGIN